MNKQLQRHIVIDESTKTIFIQVMTTITGKLRMWEYENIKRNEYIQYIPPDNRIGVANMVNNGYTIKAFAGKGFENKEYYIMQLCSFQDLTGDIILPPTTFNSN